MLRLENTREKLQYASKTVTVLLQGTVQSTLGVPLKYRWVPPKYRSVPSLVPLKNLESTVGYPVELRSLLPMHWILYAYARVQYTYISLHVL